MSSIEQYQRFLEGEWTRERPTEPGCYPVCAMGFEHEGPGCQTLRVVDFGNGKVQPVMNWGGWWWSRPIPNNFGLPSVPERTRSSRPPLPR